MNSKIPLIAVVGPTASGKSSLAVELAKLYNGEVISADSMQIYRELSIGTAKITEEEACGIPHHLTGFVSITEPYSVADFADDAKAAISDITSRGRLPIICGGTGLYVRSLLQNIDFSQGVQSTELRNELMQIAEEQGTEALAEELKKIDPVSAERIDSNNIPRMIRAIELYRLTGKTMTEHLRESRLTPSPYDFCMIGITYHDRQRLYDKINKRVDIMIENGLLDEADFFLNAENRQTAAQAIGYKELEPYFEGLISLEQATENIKQSTRRYAKRQLTWFRKEDNIKWIYNDDYEDIITQAKRIIDNHFNRKEETA